MNLTEMRAATKKELAEIVFKNGKILNVFTKEIITADVAITNGVIVGIGDFSGKTEIDVQGKFISPGFIDSHVHIESSMVVPKEYAKVVLPHGVTTVITDPHEIANVAGVKGIQFMLDASENLPLDVRVMLPSCVPATSFEKGGAELYAEDLEQFIGHPKVLGLAEVMDYPAVMNMSTQMMDKIQLAYRNQLPIDGHCAGLSINEINAYAYAGIQTDHESTTPEDVIMRTQLGMYVALREGSAARNLKDLLPAVTEKNAHRCMYCTDDKHLDDIVKEGSIDFCIRTAIQQGIDTLTAYSMATLHPAQCYNLKRKGAIAPGYEAHLVFLSNLEEVTVSDVFIQDRYYVKDGVISGKIEVTIDTDEIGSKVNLYDYCSKDFELLVGKESKANIIEINPNSIVTSHLVKEIENIDSPYIPSIKDEECKIAVIDRYQGVKEIGIGIIKGLGLVSGAIATTIAHDSHQLIVAGLNDEDILLATKTINEIGGGIVIVNEGKIIASLGLSIGGLMCKDSAEEVIKKLTQIDEALLTIRPVNTFNALLTLSFLALPVIPSLKMTTKGLFNVLDMSLHPVFEK